MDKILNDKMFNDLINIQDNESLGKCTSARDLHSVLGVGRDFTTWIKGRIKKYGFEEEVDFIIIWESKNNGSNLEDVKTIKYSAKDNSNSMVRNGYQLDYIITLDMAVELCTLEKQSENAGSLLNYLIKDIKVLTKHTYSRFEISFGDQLKQTLKPLNIKVETQKPMFDGKYRIDFYLPEFNLAIEYDEEHHQQKENKVKDGQREEEIKSCLHCKFIRLDYKNTDAYNVGLVLKEIMGRW